MKLRQYNILVAWWPDDDSADYTRTFRTLKAARRYARYLLLDQKQDEVEFSRRVPGGWMPEIIWERID